MRSTSNFPAAADASLQGRWPLLYRFHRQQGNAIGSVKVAMELPRQQHPKEWNDGVEHGRQQQRRDIAPPIPVFGALLNRRDSGLLQSIGVLIKLLDITRTPQRTEKTPKHADFDVL
jgi:hypothetical protein